MANTATTSAVLAQGTVAQMNAWVGELMTQWIATGMVQTNDTGQLTVSGGNANISALPTATGVANAVGYCIFTMPDALALGSLSTTALNTGGTGGTNGTYTALVVTGVSSGATSARASVTVAGGVAGNMTITTNGTGYIAGEKLTVSNVNIPTAANWTVATLGSGSPIVARFDFGAGVSTSAPGMWVTIGTGTNGAGVINGSAGTTKLTQVACFCASAVASTSTAYPSYYCFNPTYGFFKTVFKIGGLATAETYGQLYIYRSNTTGGAADGRAVCLIANSAINTGVSSTIGSMQVGTFGNGVLSSVTPTTPTQTIASTWAALNSTGGVFPLGLASTLVNGGTRIIPTYYWTGAGSLEFSAFVGIGLVADLAVGATDSLAIIGATPLTFLMDAGGNVGAAGGGSSAALGIVSLFQ